MQWIVEHINMDRGEEARAFIDDNDIKLVQALKDLGKDYHQIKQIPFTQTLLGFENLDLNQPTLMYGSTQITEKVHEQYPIVYSWHENIWWDPKTWVGKRDDLLNSEITTISTKDLRANWIKEPTFVKSLKVKGVTGMVIEPDKRDHDNWLIEHSEMDGDEELLLSPIHKIDREWRFFVIDGRIVTGSTYRKDGYRTTKHPVSPEAWAAAQKAITKWMPSLDIVIDICRLRSGEYKVIEFNCLSCSGFYNCDVKAIVLALEDLATVKWHSYGFGILTEGQCIEIAKNLQIGSWN